MKFLWLVTLERKRKGISRYYDIRVRTEDRESAIKRAHKLKHGMTAVRVFPLDDQFPMISSPSWIREA